MPDLSNIDLFILGLCTIAVGMVLLVKGGDWIVDGAVYVARRKGISPIVVGFTIVAFGTSFPELMASMTANLKGSPGIAIGNVLGSNLANILLVIGATAIITPLVAHLHLLLRDVIIMLLATAVLAVLMVTGAISQLAGIVFIIALLAYTYLKYRSALKGKAVVEEVDAPGFDSMLHACFFLLVGLVIIALGADLLIRGGTLTAKILGVPDLVIGLSIIALGTSLPELSTCLAAARKNHTDVVLGNIIGSNIFNILMILGLCAMAKPFDMAEIDPRAVQFDIWLTAGVTVLFAAWIVLFRKIGRVPGIALVVLYAVYIILQYKSATLPGAM